METQNKSFDKYYVKKDPASGKPIINDDGTPMLGEVAKKDCRFEDKHANILNRNWMESGVYYKEALLPFVYNVPEKELRAELFLKAGSLGLKPAKNIKTEELAKLIELTKEEGEN